MRLHLYFEVLIFQLSIFASAFNKSIDTQRVSKYTPLYERATKDAGSSRSPTLLSIYNAIKELSNNKLLMVSPPDVGSESIAQSIGISISPRKKLIVLYIAWLGSTGDVTTSASIWAKMLSIPNMFEVHALVEPRSIPYLPEFLVKLDEFPNFKKKLEAQGPVTDQTAAFFWAVKEQLSKLKADIIINGHAFGTMHYPASQWDPIYETLEAQAVADQALIVFSRSDYTPAAHSEELDYMHYCQTKWASRGTTLAMMKQVEAIPAPDASIAIAANMVNLYGQQREFWTDDPDPHVGGLFVGKLPWASQKIRGPQQTSAQPQGKYTQELFAFIDGARAQTPPRKVMYLGFGGDHRDWEAYKPTASLQKFVATYLAESKDTWEFILFHNIKRPSNGGQANTANVFHLYYGDLGLLSVFERVDAALHHGGAGTTSDCIAAGTPQIVLPYGFRDQSYLALRVDCLRIGVALQPVQNSDNGGLDEYEAGWIRTGFDILNEDLKGFKNRVQLLSTEYTKNTGASNSVDVILRLVDANLRRYAERNRIGWRKRKVI